MLPIQGTLGSIPSQGTRSHMPELRPGAAKKKECGHGTFPQRVSVLRGRAAERLRGVPESQTGCYFSAKARCSRPTVFAQGTLLSVMWQLGCEGSLEESGYLYMHDQVPLLST